MEDLPSDMPSPRLTQRFAAGTSTIDFPDDLRSPDGLKEFQEQDDILDQSEKKVKKGQIQMPYLVPRSREEIEREVMMDLMEIDKKYGVYQM